MWQHASTERYNITNVYGMNTWNKENQKLKYVVSRQHIKKTSGQVHFFLHWNSLTFMVKNWQLVMWAKILILRHVY